MTQTYFYVQKGANVQICISQKYTVNLQVHFIELTPDKVYVKYADKNMSRLALPFSPKIGPN